jgi:hypothetical protein
MLRRFRRLPKNGIAVESGRYWRRPRPAR